MRSVITRWIIVVIVISCALLSRANAATLLPPNDRQALVTRHNVELTKLEVVQVGNGDFAFSADITGFHTFEPRVIISHCGWDSTAWAHKLQVMAVGDSITVGGTAPRWRVKFAFGYRSLLYSRLKDAGYNVQLVGESRQPWNYHSATVDPPTEDQIDHSVVDLRTVNQDGHDGYCGKGISFISGKINALLADVSPNVVLLMIGINDITCGTQHVDPKTTSKLDNLVQQIVSASPEAHLIVAQITPYTRYTGAIVEYNEYIKNTLIPRFLKRGKHVTTVDQYSIFLDANGSIDPSLFSNGINHPNKRGYDRMARVWLEGIQKIIPPETQSDHEDVKGTGTNGTVAF